LSSFVNASGSGNLTPSSASASFNLRLPLVAIPTDSTYFPNAIPFDLSLVNTAFNYRATGGLDDEQEKD
jgi:hypothetical protein